MVQMNEKSGSEPYVSHKFCKEGFGIYEIMFGVRFI